MTGTKEVSHEQGARPTPGPWRWAEDWKTLVVCSDGDKFDGDKYADLGLYSARGKPLLALRIDHYDAEWNCPKDPREDLSDADRALIAAAPELLEALRACAVAINEELNAAEPWQDHPTLVMHSKVLKRARAALTKAEGA